MTRHAFRPIISCWYSIRSAYHFYHTVCASSFWDSILLTSAKQWCGILLFLQNIQYVSKIYSVVVRDRGCCCSVHVYSALLFQLQSKLSTVLYCTVPSMQYCYVFLDPQSGKYDTWSLDNTQRQHVFHMNHVTWIMWQWSCAWHDVGRLEEARTMHAAAGVQRPWQVPSIVALGLLSVHVCLQ